ncbi:hypothetical protein [Limnoglobus roseus]|uniref:Uncharacterized protein n=1 Tax=Limnoglobus roseus TaxID=2598579 RepID=A0A5C1AEF3_9BACT|nr:hypothetical protein [Limnoglobus roseus]QEL17779.1 hypothetical protein PX52LOC_04785 [Limnoglobus roseus]
MTDDELRPYRLELRFRQAVITLQYAEACGTAEGYGDARSAFDRLLAAYDDWPGPAPGSSVRTSWTEQLNALGTELIRRRQCPDRAAGESLAAVLDRLAAGVREWLGGRVPATAAWCALGDAVAEVYFDDDSPGADFWPSAVGDALAELGVDRATLFRGTGDGQAAFGDSLPPFRYRQAWISLEGGLVPRSSPPARRRQWADRDDQLLRMYEDPSADTHRSPTRVRMRWNRLHPGNPMELEAVKKALKRARKSRQSENPSPPDAGRG